MKKVLTFVAVVALTAGSAYAADGTISTQRAARLGLSGMQPMSAEQGAQIRGLGFGVVAGVSRAQSGGTSSTNLYVGGSRRNNALAAGAAGSKANNNTAIGGSIVFAR